MKSLCGIFLIIGSSISYVASAEYLDFQFEEKCMRLASHAELSGNDKVQEVLMSYSEIMHFYQNKIEAEAYAILAEREKELTMRYASKMNAMTSAKLDTFLSQSKHFFFAFSQ